MQLEHDAGAQSKYVDSVVTWTCDREALHLPPPGLFTRGDIVRNSDPRLHACQTKADVMCTFGYEDPCKADDLFNCRDQPWEVMATVTHAQAQEGADVTLTLEPVDPIFRRDAGQFTFTIDCVEV
jgi:hypothetical protein